MPIGLRCHYLGLSPSVADRVLVPRVAASFVAVIDSFSDQLRASLLARGYKPHDSQIFRPSHLGILRDAKKLILAVSQTSGGVAEVLWLDRPTVNYHPDALRNLLIYELGWAVSALVVLPRPDLTSGTSYIGCIKSLMCSTSRVL